MDKNRIKKWIVGIITAILIFFVGKVVYAFTYVGNIVVTYPWNEYTISEKIASYITGNGKPATAQELYDKGLIKDTKGPFRKFNNSFYKD